MRGWSAARKARWPPRQTPNEPVQPLQYSCESIHSMMLWVSVSWAVRALVNLSSLPLSLPWSSYARIVPI